MLLRIGTRGSKLALAQSRWVRGEILARHPDVQVELVRIKTTGDKILDTPLSRIGGKGLFVTEIEEALLRRDVDLARLRDVRQMRYGYKIELQNLLSEEAKIELRDHIPVARHEEIKVKLEKVSPDPAERNDLNILEWRLQLPPGAKKEIRYEFQVEHPRSIEVIGLG